jgi:hypothetical protein
MADKKKKDADLGVNFSPDLLELLEKFKEIELEDFKTFRRGRCFKYRKTA